MLYSTFSTTPTISSSPSSASASQQQPPSSSSSRNKHLRQPVSRMKCPWTSTAWEGVYVRSRASTFRPDQSGAEFRSPSRCFPSCTWSEACFCCRPLILCSEFFPRPARKLPVICGKLKKRITRVGKSLKLVTAYLYFIIHCDEVKYLS